MLLAYVIGIILAVFDLLSLGTIKNISAGLFSHNWFYFVFAISFIQPVLFYFGMKYTSMTLLNLIWDLLSDIIVTISGLVYFKESLSGTKSIGLLFALLALTMFNIDDFKQHI